MLDDTSRQQISTMIPEVVGLHPHDDRVSAALVLSTARAALPVAAEERQNIMALAILNAEGILAERDGRSPGQLSDASRRALMRAPAAERWARIHLARMGFNSAALRPSNASKIVALAVDGVARACIDDPEERLVACCATASTPSRRSRRSRPLRRRSSRPSGPSAPHPCAAVARVRDGSAASSADRDRLRPSSGPGAASRRAGSWSAAAPARLPARSHVVRVSTSVSSARIWTRARWAPRQKCGPCPKARCARASRLDVESVGSREDLLVTVGRGERHDHLVAGRDRLAGHLRVASSRCGGRS